MSLCLMAATIVDLPMEFPAIIYRFERFLITMALGNTGLLEDERVLCSQCLFFSHLLACYCSRCAEVDEHLQV
jgi:hypothetical protein